MQTIIEVNLETGEQTEREMTPEEIAALPVLTAEQIAASISADVQRHLDAAAQARGYDDIKSAVSYAEEPAVPRFQADGLAFRKWRSLVWAKCYAIQADVQAGTRAMVTSADVMAELPTLELPA